MSFHCDATLPPVASDGMVLVSAAWLDEVVKLARRGREWRDESTPLWANSLVSQVLSVRSNPTIGGSK